MNHPERDVIVFVDLPSLGSKKNQYAPGTRNGRPTIRLSRKSADTRQALAAYFEAEILTRRLTIPVPAPQAVTVRLAANIRTDIDNAIGHLFDAMQKAGIVKNDRDISWMIVERTGQKYSSVAIWTRGKHD